MGARVTSPRVRLGVPTRQSCILHSGEHGERYLTIVKVSDLGCERCPAWWRACNGHSAVTCALYWSNPITIIWGLLKLHGFTPARIIRAW